MEGRAFEEVEHTADVALRVWGRDLAELFTNAARGMAWLLGDAEPAGPPVEISLRLSAYDVETLLVSWLEELLFHTEQEGLIFVDFWFQDMGSTHLVATARGHPVQEMRRHIKAVTFSEMAVRSGERGLETTIVFDV
jgi:SHS2 domain-containing protein